MTISMRGITGAALLTGVVLGGIALMRTGLEGSPYSSSCR